MTISERNASYNPVADSGVKFDMFRTLYLIRADDPMAVVLDDDRAAVTGRLEAR